MQSERRPKAGHSSAFVSTGKTTPLLLQQVCVWGGGSVQMLPEYGIMGLVNDELKEM